MNLKLSAWGAIISLVAYFLLIVLTSLGFVLGYNKILGISLIITLFVGIIAGYFIILGYLTISKKTKNSLMKVSSYLMLILIIINGMYNLYYFKTLLINPDSLINSVTVILYIQLGVVYILLGSSVLKLKKMSGSLASVLGILYIVEGAFYTSLILISLATLMPVPVSIFEAILFFKLAGKMR